MNNDLCSLKSWLQADKLPLNVATTQGLVVGSRKRLEVIRDDKIAKLSFVVSEENVANRIILEASMAYLKVTKRFS